MIGLRAGLDGAAPAPPARVEVRKPMVAPEKVTRLLDVLQDNLSDLRRYAAGLPSGACHRPRAGLAVDP